MFDTIIWWIKRQNKRRRNNKTIIDYQQNTMFWKLKHSQSRIRFIMSAHTHTHLIWSWQLFNSNIKISLSSRSMHWFAIKWERERESSIAMQFGNCIHHWNDMRLYGQNYLNLWILIFVCVCIRHWKQNDNLNDYDDNKNNNKTHFAAYYNILPLFPFFLVFILPFSIQIMQVVGWLACWH